MTSRLIKSGLIIISAVCFTAGTFGQTLSFKLKEAQDFAVQNSYSVKNSQFDLEMAKNRLKKICRTACPRSVELQIILIILLYLHTLSRGSFWPATGRIRRGPVWHQK